MFVAAQYQFRAGAVPADTPRIGSIGAMQYLGPHAIDKHQVPLPGSPTWFHWRVNADGSQVPMVRLTDGQDVPLRPGDFVLNQNGPKVYGLVAFHGMFKILSGPAALTPR